MNTPGLKLEQRSADSESTTDPSVWIDLASPSHPYFFEVLARELPGEYTTTVRDKTETVALAEASSLDPVVLGKDFDHRHLRKLGIPLRTAQLAMAAPPADVSFSSRNAMCVLASKLRGIPSIHFTDNDVTAHVDGLFLETLYNRFEASATHNIVPSAFAASELIRNGGDAAHIHTYDGYKEDVYVADFEPDPAFEASLPVNEYVVVRPEALSAAYVETDRSIVPDLLNRFVDRGYDVVYLPRGRGDDHHAESYPYDRVYVPSRPVDGRQLAWHARCVLTGSGTMAREAACMHKPAVSFFPNTPLSVDQALIDAGRVMYSREPDAIVSFVDALSEADQQGDVSRSARVRDEVVSLVAGIIDRLPRSSSS